MTWLISIPYTQCTCINLLSMMLKGERWFWSWIIGAQHDNWWSQCKLKLCDKKVFNTLNQIFKEK